MKPYNNIQSTHLGFLLFIARATAVIGLLLFIFSILMFCLTFLGKSIGAMSLVTFLPMSMGVIFFSGLLAVLVAWEEGYRMRTEHMINSEKT
ncbi:hypothetical protein [Paraglaciecola sp. 2405UD69-4]|uniref:hypothetical protein n=1 Tax=Paraglaciecola sp. 2405UD69-4 TaxID=3391836 RepID=UPI0039C966EE